jgi:D-alanyl-D-alanine carboxypeptidase
MKQQTTFRTCILVSWFATIGILLFITYQHHYKTMTTLNTFLHQQAEQGKTPSIQYAIFDADKVIYQTHAGASDIRSGALADSNTTYHLYSITKTATAVLVMQLAAEGKLDLQKPIADYLPGFRYDKRITVLQLLNHTSGIPNPMPLQWIHTAAEHDAFDRDSYFDNIILDHNKLEFEPGTKFNYSNLEYIILGQLIEKITGQSFEEAVQERIITKCGIESTSLHFAIDSNTHATGYHPYWSVSYAILNLMIDKNKFMDPRVGKWKPFKPFYNNGTAYGGLIGSATGLRQYAQALLKENSPLLNDLDKQKMFAENMINGKGTGMSLSWFTSQLNGHRYVTHAGGGGGYYTELRLYPDLGIGSLIMYNRSGMRDVRALDQADSYFLPAKQQS